MSRRLVPAIAALALATSGLAAAISPADAARPAEAASPAAATAAAPTPSTKLVKSPYGMRASGYGTRVRGGQIPAGSGTTAYDSTGCTTSIGREAGNTQAGVNLQGLGTVGAVDTSLRTEKVNGQIASVSEHKVAGINLDLGAGTGLSITAINTIARAYHDKTGFHATSDTTIGNIVLTVGGIATPIPIPAPDTPIVIPGLVSIEVGRSEIKEGPNGAQAREKGVQIEIPAAGAKLKIAASFASIEDGVTFGPLHGNASTTRIAVLGDLITSGPTLKIIMPCAGTGGEVKSKELAGVNLANQLVIGAATSTQMGKQSKTRAIGFEQAQVAKVDLGNGALVINAITGRVNVSRVKGKKAVANANGTTVGSIIANGQEQAIPDPGQAIEIPGLAKIAFNVQEKIPGGLHVIAIQITLLDGTAAVINIGEAKLAIRKG